MGDESELTSRAVSLCVELVCILEDGEGALSTTCVRHVKLLGSCRRQKNPKNVVLRRMTMSESRRSKTSFKKG